MTGRLVELVDADGVAVVVGGARAAAVDAGRTAVGPNGVAAGTGGVAAGADAVPVGAGRVAVGAATVEEVHRAPGRLHRAFSVFLRDPDGRVLLQQRSAAKTRFPLRWANTCCGHPAPGEDVRVAAARRIGEELGVGVAELTEVGRYTYYAEDPATGLVEYEYDHVLLGDLPPGEALRPDPDEVADLRWVGLPVLLVELGSGSRAYAPWLSGVTARMADHLAQSAPDPLPQPNAGLLSRVPPDGLPSRVLPDRRPRDQLAGNAAETGRADDAPEPPGGR